MISPASDALDLPATSWGEGGDFRVWSNPQTDWMWPRIHAAEFAMRDAVRSLPSADPLTKLYLNQAARELLLLSSSDWPFLITTGQARDYAAQRFTEHVERFDDCIAAATNGGASEGARRRLALYAETDNAFARIDYRIFG